MVADGLNDVPAGPIPMAGRQPAASPILFMHIPKTAGTSVRHTLDAVYGPHERAFVYEGSRLDGAIGLHELEQLPDDQRLGLQLVLGHFPFGLHRMFPGRPRYVTMMRGPVDRVMSLYFHYKHRLAPPPGSREAVQHADIRENELSLEDWAFDPARLEADNGMVRQLLGHPGVAHGACTEAMLEEAVANIDEHFDAVLIRGFMRDSMEILSRVIGRDLPAPTRANVNPERPTVDSLEPRLRRRLWELNELDARLFELMLDRFPESHARWTA